jgi:hypothetical protein
VAKLFIQLSNKRVLVMAIASIGAVLNAKGYGFCDGGH